MMNRPCPEEYHLVGAQGSIDMQVRALQKSHRCCCLHTGNHIRKKRKEKKRQLAGVDDCAVDVEEQ